MVRSGLAYALALLLLAGCGGTNDATRPASTAPTTTATTAERPTPSPKETLRAVQSAVRGAESFHIEGAQTDEEGVTRLEGDVAADGAVRLSMRQPKGAVEIIVLDEETVFIRADATFWKQSDAPASVQELLAGRWAEVPADEDAAELAEQVRPDTVAHCLGTDVGTLRLRDDTLGGDDVLVLVDAGDRPGTTPGELYIAPGDPLLPLRIRQTGARRPGGPPVDKRCGPDDKRSPEDRSDVRLSRWNEPLEIEAPPDALDLEDIANGTDEEPTV